MFLQAYGGGGGATSVDFDLKGQAWEWGDYGLDQVCLARSRITKLQPLLCCSMMNFREHYSLGVPHQAPCRFKVAMGYSASASNTQATLLHCRIMHSDVTFVQLQMVAHGSYHSDEGIQLEKFSLEAGVPLPHWWSRLHNMRTRSQLVITRSLC